jgi:hypothetical protein
MLKIKQWLTPFSVYKVVAGVNFLNLKEHPTGTIHNQCIIHHFIPWKFKVFGRGFNKYKNANI